MSVSSVWEKVNLKNGEKIEDALKFFRRIPLFEDLGEKELRKVEALIHRRTYRPGELVFSEGEPGVGMYIIKKGQVEIFWKDSKGNDKLVSTLSDGDFFGDLALLDDSPRSASARSKDEAELLALLRPDLFDLINRDPLTGSKILMKLALIISLRLRKSDIELKKVSLT